MSLPSLPPPRLLLTCLAMALTCPRCSQVGILPTDTYPALVCDVDARNAIERLYSAKGMAANKPLSILCRNFTDVNTYTLGFPVGAGSGRPDVFRVARRALPGPVSFPEFCILPCVLPEALRIAALDRTSCALCLEKCMFQKVALCSLLCLNLLSVSDL